MQLALAIAADVVGRVVCKLRRCLVRPKIRQRILPAVSLELTSESEPGESMKSPKRWAVNFREPDCCKGAVWQRKTVGRDLLP